MGPSMFNYKDLLSPYSPWIAGGIDASPTIPSFYRPIFQVLLDDLERIPQILSITGPRRIGKTTLILQVVTHLLKRGVPHDRIIYYSMDDPALSRRGISGEDLLDQMMKDLAKVKDGPPAYVFLDEIQRLDRWELYVKKYYDLKYPVRMMISGSASSPIFKKSRESLLGRVKDYHLLPFSFREFLLFRLQGREALIEEVDRLHKQGRTLQGLVSGDPHVEQEPVLMTPPSRELWQCLQDELSRYFLEGGFPEVWSLPDWIAKQEYLFENQVKKVIYEDLVLAAEFRKPELIKRFYISLLETPGREVNLKDIGDDIELRHKQIEKYLPLLEMTDLVYHVEKFRKSPLRVRKGKMKFYLVDLALRNAVLRLSDKLLSDHTMLGLYAENLVYLALRKWRGTIQMDYYRERDSEVDFIVHVGHRLHVPIEVKYRDKIRHEDEQGLRSFIRRFRVNGIALLITKKMEDLGREGNIVRLPLPLFLLLFD